MMETWKSVKGFEGLYEVSNYGRVKSLNYHRTGEAQILKPGRTNGGYMNVVLTKDKIRYSKRVHRLVADAFLPNPNNYTELNHKDENPANNRLYNLEWCSREYNINYGSRNKKVSEKMSKKIIQYTMDGEIVKVWKSQKEVEKTLGWSQGTISLAVNKKIPSFHGFLWEFAA